MKVENTRMDILSRKPYSREELIRFVIKDNNLIIDSNDSLPGRGVYLLKGKGAEAIRKKTFNSFLHRPLNEKEEEILANL